MKEFEVELKIRNNRLKERREALGLSAPKLCKKLHLPYTMYLDLENLKPKGNPFVTPGSKGPLHTGRIGDWRPWIKKLARFYKTTPAELFPESIFAVGLNKVTKKVDGADVAPLLSGTCDRLLPAEVCEDTDVLLIEKEELENILQMVDNEITPRERSIIMHRTGIGDADELTLDEIGEKYDISKERVRQIERQGYHKIRKKILNAR